MKRSVWSVVGFALWSCVTGGWAAEPGRRPQSPEELRVAAAARAFRIQVYEAFHLHREAYDACIAQGREVDRLWNLARVAQQEAEHERAIRAWFETALTHVQSKADATLPEAPTLTFATKIPAETPAPPANTPAEETNPFEPVNAGAAENSVDP